MQDHIGIFDFVNRRTHTLLTKALGPNHAGERDDVVRRKLSNELIRLALEKIPNPDAPYIPMFDSKTGISRPGAMRIPRFYSHIPVSPKKYAGYVDDEIAETGLLEAVGMDRGNIKEYVRSLRTFGAHSSRHSIVCQLLWLVYSDRYPWMNPNFALLILHRSELTVTSIDQAVSISSQDRQITSGQKDTNGLISKITRTSTLFNEYRNLDEVEAEIEHIKKNGESALVALTAALVNPEFPQGVRGEWPNFLVSTMGYDNKLICRRPNLLKYARFGLDAPLAKLWEQSSVPSDKKIPMSVVANHLHIDSYHHPIEARLGHRMTPEQIQSIESAPDSWVDEWSAAK